MALTDGFLAIVIALGLIYYFMFCNPIRWVRIAGCFGVIVVSIGFGAIADTLPFFILMMVNFMIGGLKLAIEVGEIIGDIR